MELVKRDGKGPLEFLLEIKKKPYRDVLPESEFEMAPHNTLERALIRRNQFGKLG